MADLYLQRRKQPQLQLQPQPCQSVREAISYASVLVEWIMENFALPST